MSAKKSLSQNFLLDKQITDRFVASAGDLTGKHVLEVGPGPGLLTRSIIDANPAKLTVVEKDHRFMPFLTHLANACDGRVDIVHSDILKFDYNTVIPGSHSKEDKQAVGAPSELHIIGNLPFGVATPLLFQFLRMSVDVAGPFFKFDALPELTLCFQKEVAIRMTAEAGHSDRCRLSCMVQHCCDADIVYDLPSAVFVPAPKVDAAVVQLMPKRVPHKISFDEMDAVTQSIFWARRKTITNNICASLSYSKQQTEHALAIAGISRTVRAQALDNEQIYSIIEALKDIDPTPILSWSRTKGPQKRIRQQPHH